MGRKPGSKNKPRIAKDPNLDETPGEGVQIQKSGKGRPVGHHYGLKRNVQFSLAERIRERHHPDLIIDHWEMILQGHNPVWVPDARAKGGFRIEPDPNPLNPSPNLAQRNEAIKELTNRGHGLPVQSIQLDAQFKAQMDSGLPANALEGKPNLKLLAELSNLMKKFAEQDSDQVETPTDSGISGVLQETGQTPPDVQIVGLSDAGKRVLDVTAQVVEDLILNNEAVNEYKEISNPTKPE